MSAVTQAAQRIIFFSLVIFGAIALVSTQVVAQSVQGPRGSDASDFFSGSTKSDFQGSGFQQSDGGSAAVTAGGSSDVLRQVNGGQLTVSGAPASTSANSNQNSTAKLWFTIIFAASGIGLLIVYIYTRRTKAKQDVAAEVFTQELTKDIKPAPKAAPAVKSEEQPTPVKKDKPKKKKKNKKHHR